MIWLVGCNGMLGTEIRDLLAVRGWPHVATDAETDITSEDEVARMTRALAPDWILNCAAYTAVDRAESEEEEAYRVNAEGAGHLARAATACGAHLIHVSTDYVLSGREDGAQDETVAVDPLGAYGRTKAAGERLVREACDRHSIVRTAWLHGASGGGFVATMLRLMIATAELRVVDDQRGCPTYSADLADALLAFIAHDGDTPCGTYHYVNEGSCTWHGFAREIQAQALACGLLPAPVNVAPVSSSAYARPAPRPANSVLSTAKIRAALGVEIPSWQDGLSRHLRRRMERDG